MDAEPVLDGSAVLVAVTLTVDGEGTAEGAVYSPALSTVPHAEALHPAPCTLHVTAVFEVPTTDAVNCCVAPVPTDVLPGATLTPTTGIMVTDADAVLLASAMLVATTLMLAGEGATLGAEYTAVNALVANVPQEVPLHPAPVKLHATAVFDVPVTVAVNVPTLAVGTEALDGLTLSKTAVAKTTVILAEADLDGSATLVALTLRIAGEGTLAGAV
ncbi:MAG TPA: hypothetical protein VNH65_14270 [Candidatus Acidoferrum sp.]|nr:hypothetical protein [Candidatus Acidoferrum sp.]